MDIICFSTTDWYEIWGSRQQIMTRMASHGHRVLFVERQINPEYALRNGDYFLKKILDAKNKRLVQIKPNLWRWQPPIVLPGRYYSQSLNVLGQKRIARHIKYVLANLGFHNPILWIYPPQSAPLIGQFSEQLAIYHCIERFSGDQKGRKRRVMESQEEDLLRKVDIVFTHSLGLLDRYSHLTRRPIIFLPSAADVAHFQSTSQIHPDIQKIPRPRLVIMGTLDQRLDWQLLSNIARTKPNWHLVMIGNIRQPPKVWKEFAQHKNVHLLGSYNFDQLPALLNGADVNLIPYRLTEMTSYINPLKAYEYLSVGKPIVSIELPELATLQAWMNLVKFSLDHGALAQDFIAAIQHALESDNLILFQQKRKAAKGCDWDDRVAKILQSIESVGLEHSS